ncbi:hypothetical protein ACFL0W_01680 [Nanoarchaeota archaeon]
MVSNLRKHEIIGLIMLFLAGTCFGAGIYITFYMANFYGELNQILRGGGFVIFPLFFGVGSVLWALGKIELKYVTPGKKL